MNGYVKIFLLQKWFIILFFLRKLETSLSLKDLSEMIVLGNISYFLKN